MKNPTLPLLAVLALSAPSRADVVACPSGTVPGVICLSGAVADTAGGGPLLSGQVYHVVGNLRVPAGATLTVEPGAIVKVAASTIFDVDGTLLALPGAVFTSIDDDTAGGDTNGNGAATQGQRGDWPGIELLGSGSALDSCEVRFAVTGVKVLSDATVVNCEIRECALAALDLNDTAHPTVTNNDFDDSLRPVVRVPITALPGFDDNRAAGNDESDAIEVGEGTVDVNLALRKQQTLNDTGVFELSATPGGILVNAGVLLDVQPGVTVKFSRVLSQSVQVFGTVTAHTANFTSLRDDTLGGDTNKDGNATVPAPRDWNGFLFEPGSGASALTNVIVRYAGDGGPAGTPSIVLDQADVLLDTVLVEDGASHALELSGNSFPTVVGCGFADNGGHVVNGVRIQALAGFSANVAAGNALGDHVRVDASPHAVAANLALDADHTTNQSGVIALETAVTVPGGVALAVAPGLIFKADANGSLAVDGTLLAQGTGLARVSFTSLADDTLGGDTNNNGAATAPTPGDWGGLVFRSGSDASVLDEVLVRYAGGVLPASLRFEGDASPTIRNSTVELGAKIGLQLTADARPSVSDSDVFAHGGVPVSNVNILAVPGFDDVSAGGNVGGDHMTVGPATVPATEASVAIDPSNSLNGDGVFVLLQSIQVSPGAALDVGGGCELRMPAGSSVDVDGVLTAGSEGSSTLFTSGAPAPSAGDWIGLDFTNASDASVLQDVEVRFAGSLGRSIRLFFADVTLTNVTVRNGAGDALDLSGNSFPTVNGCHFQDNAFAVDGVPLGALDGFADNTASANLFGDYARVTTGVLAADLLVRRIQSPNQGPIVLAADVVVPAGVKLGIDPGVLLKWEGFRSLTVGGTLEVLASAGIPAIFTSIHDDVVGGDTNKNGSATVPAPGDWSHVAFNGADLSIVNGAIFRFAGGGGLGCLRLSFSEMKLLDSVVELGAGDAIDLGNTSGPRIRGCRFEQCTGIAIDGAPLTSIARFRDNTASGNLVYDSIRVLGTQSPTGASRIARCNTLNADGVVVMEGATTVQTGARLTLDPGIVMKFVPGSFHLTNIGALDLQGAGHDPVVLTSLADDEFGGDTNKDGSATVPAPGDWRGVDHSFLGAASVVRHVIVRYAGAVGAAGFSCSNGGATVTSVRAEHCAANGIAVSAVAGALENAVAYDCAGAGISTSFGSFDVSFATAVDCGGVGLAKGGGHSGVLTSSISFGNAGGATSGWVAGQVFSSNAGPALAGANGNIDADPLFLDRANGDLRLGAASPCIGAAEAAAADAAVHDFEERSRRLDHDLSGLAEPDMGAYERAVFELVAAGTMCAGELVSFTAVGPAGTAEIVIAELDDAVFVDPFGFDRLGRFVSRRRIVPTGQPIVVRLPQLALLPSLAVQARVFPPGDPTVGNLTQVIRLRFPAPNPQAAAASVR